MATIQKTEKRIVGHEVRDVGSNEMVDPGIEFGFFFKSYWRVFFKWV